MKTTTTQKTATTKTANKKAETKTAQKVKPYAVLLKDALSGTYGSKVQGYFLTAFKWHGPKGKATQFPRFPNETAEGTEADKVKAYFTECQTKGASICKDKRMLIVFDKMIVEAYPDAKVPAL